MSRNTTNWTLISFWAHPEKVLDERARAATSGFARQKDVVVQRVVSAVASDLNSRKWDERYGHLQSLDKCDVGLRIITATIN